MAKFDWMDWTSAMLGLLLCGAFAVLGFLGDLLEHHGVTLKVVRDWMDANERSAAIEGPKK